MDSSNETLNDFSFPPVTVGAHNIKVYFPSTCVCMQSVCTLYMHNTLFACIAGILRGLHPFTNYAVTLTACTLAGCTESLHALNISTPQEGKVISKVLTSTFQS